jgi:hypothetical protein
MLKALTVRMHDLGPPRNVILLSSSHESHHTRLWQRSLTFQRESQVGNGRYRRSESPWTISLASIFLRQLPIPTRGD